MARGGAGWHAADVYEQPLSGRRFGLSFFLVLIVLAGVAGTGAYVVTRQIVGNGSQNPSADATSNPTSATTEITPTAATTAATPGEKATDKATPNPYDPATFCPAITEKAVRDAGLAGELRLLRYVDGQGQRIPGAEAWICKNKDGVLIYQGHRRSGPFNAANSSDTILLATGIRGKVEQRGDEFVATSPKDVANVNDPTHADYHVSATAFFIIDVPGQHRTEYIVTRTVP